MDLFVSFPSSFPANIPRLIQAGFQRIEIKWKLEKEEKEKTASVHINGSKMSQSEYKSVFKVVEINDTQFVSLLSKNIILPELYSTKYDEYIKIINHHLRDINVLKNEGKFHEKSFYHPLFFKDFTTLLNLFADFFSDSLQLKQETAYDFYIVLNHHSRFHFTGDTDFTLNFQESESSINFACCELKNLKDPLTKNLPSSICELFAECLAELERMKCIGIRPLLFPGLLTNGYEWCFTIIQLKENEYFFLRCPVICLNNDENNFRLFEYLSCYFHLAATIAALNRADDLSHLLKIKQIRKIDEDSDNYEDEDEDEDENEDTFDDNEEDNNETDHGLMVDLEKFSLNILSLKKEKSSKFSSLPVSRPPFRTLRCPFLFRTRETTATKEANSFSA